MKEGQVISINGLRYHLVEYGSPDQECIIFLHGFPDFHYGWRKQTQYFVERDYRLLLPDQRGYNLSEKPREIEHYTLDKLSKDLLALIDYSGQKKVYLVGHDWGGSVAWWFAQQYPERLHKLAILSVPHHKVFRDHLKYNWAQRKRSWYMLYYQLPWLPDWSLGWGKWVHLSQALANSVRASAIEPSDLDKYTQAWSQPGAMTAMLNWYRALRKPLSKTKFQSKIKVPTLLFWGARDPYLGEEMAQPSIDLCEKGELIIVPATRHWPHWDQPDLVNEAILEFFHRRHE